jgi:hypothetical protein
LLANSALLVERVHRRELSGHVEAHASAIIFTQAEIHKLAPRCIVVELARRPHLQQEREAELIAVAAYRLSAPAFRVEAVSDLVVNLCGDQDDSRIDERPYYPKISLVIS